jgi:hypothetical protein
MKQICVLLFLLAATLNIIVLHLLLELLATAQQTSSEKMQFELVKMEPNSRYNGINDTNLLAAIKPTF